MSMNVLQSLKITNFINLVEIRIPKKFSVSFSILGY